MSNLPPLILLVEDEPDLRDVITDIIEAAGFRMEVASNYTDGVILLNASRPAVLIANVLLPAGGDGHKLAEAASRLGIPALLISGHPQATVEAEARGIPFLAKPFGLADLQRVIRTLVEPEPSTTELDPTVASFTEHPAPASRSWWILVAVTCRCSLCSTDRLRVLVPALTVLQVQSRYVSDNGHWS